MHTGWACLPKLLIFLGDKSGRLGGWDVMDVVELEGVEEKGDTTQFHACPTNPFKYSICFTCSWSRYL